MKFTLKTTAQIFLLVLGYSALLAGLMELFPSIKKLLLPTVEDFTIFEFLSFIVLVFLGFAFFVMCIEVIWKLFKRVFLRDRREK